MGTEGRRAAPDLKGLLVREPFQFRFFQAVRLLQRLHPGQTLDELVRFKSEVSLAFPPSELAEVDVEGTDDTTRYTLTVRLLGLLGRSSILPDHYLERAHALARKKDHAFTSFLDLFNHRLLTLLYQAWEHARPQLKAERGENELLTGALEALTGLRVGPKARVVPFERALVLGQASQFMRGTVSAESAIGLLRLACPGVGLELVQFDPQQLPLEDESRFCLKRGGRGNQLGRFCPLGRRVWDVQSRVRLKVGPLRGARWDDFGPDGPGALRIQAIWQALTGGEFDLCIERVLASESGNRWKLGRGQARLGRSSWLSRGGR